MPILKKHRVFFEKIKKLDFKYDLLPNNIVDYKNLCEDIKKFSEKLYEIFLHEAKIRGDSLFVEMDGTNITSPQKSNTIRKISQKHVKNLDSDIENIQTSVEHVKEFKQTASTNKVKSTSLKYIQDICISLKEISKCCKNLTFANTQKSRDNINKVLNHTKTLRDLLVGNPNTKTGLKYKLQSVIKNKKLSSIAVLNNHSIKKVFKKWVNNITNINDNITKYSELEIARIKASDAVLNEFKNYEYSKEIIEKWKSIFFYYNTKEKEPLLNGFYTLHFKGSDSNKLKNRIYVSDKSIESGIQECINKIIKQIKLLESFLHNENIEK